MIKLKVEMEDHQSNSIRVAVFDWLEKTAPQYEYVIDWNLLTKGFSYKGEVIPLIGAKGIWKPKAISRYPISITSVQKSIYSDEFIDNETLSYSYRGVNPLHPDNVGLREAMTAAIPLVYFHQLFKGKYFVAWPVFIVGDEPERLKFMVSAESYAMLQGEASLQDPSTIYRRKYQTREILIRLHQKSFRERVLKAYQEHCAICKLKHRSLLDAAHIIPDTEGGSPEVRNGLALCKIHHAAYDHNIIGINADYNIEVREDVLAEIDGPMLKHGLQEFNNKRIIIPRSAGFRPDRDWLDIRYQKFKQMRL